MTLEWDSPRVLGSSPVTEHSTSIPYYLFRLCGVLAIDSVDTGQSSAGVGIQVCVTVGITAHQGHHLDLNTQVCFKTGKLSTQMSIVFCTLCSGG
jgi:hypothetical protein